MKTTLSLLIVALDPGQRLRATLNSVFAQDYRDYEIIIKDGGSKDGALEELQNEGFFEGHDNVRIIVAPDKSIYDGMNQGIKELNSEYVMFLNCGDTLHDEKVLSNVARHLKNYTNPHIIYGDQYNIVQKSVVSSAPEINDFTIFRNVPCHQVCFYSTKLFEERGYKIEYKVRGDYEHFLYCMYEKGAEAVHIPVVICDYEGGGYSETKENRIRSKEEHREITDKYMGSKAKKYRAIMALTLAPVRTAMAESKTFSKGYNAIKSLIYKA